MFNVFKKKDSGLAAIMRGEVIRMEDVPDEVFSAKMMGDGYAVKPVCGEIYSPCNGEVISVFKTSHAYIIRSIDGLEIIVHVGLNTVKLRGEGFDVKIKEGDHVKRGQLISTVDMDLLEKEGASTISPVIITNMELVERMNVNVGNAKELTVAMTYDLK